MINTFVWDKPRGTVVYKEPDYMITYKKGFESISCQCYKDCSCIIDNKIRDVELYRVSGKNRNDRVPKPHNFNTFNDAMERINQLKRQCTNINQQCTTL
jgi:hypothetical protein